jgi:hypothetical protein
MVGQTDPAPGGKQMTARIRTTIATLAAMLAITAVAAVPAHATDNADGTSKKGCALTLQNPDGSPGQTVVYDHGYSFSVKNKATGKTHTYTCKDGKWEETVNFTPGIGGRLPVITQVVAKTTGTLVVASPRTQTASRVTAIHRAAL